MNRLTINIAELQELLGISYVTAYKLAMRDDFPSFRVGKRILIDRVGLGVWMEEQAKKDKSRKGRKND